MIEKNMLLTDDDRVLLMRMRDLLEEITETLDIAEDEEALNSIEKAEEDVKTGRLRKYNDFVGELKSGKRLS
ncbi:unnamed protein product [marine sediment metagenome]|uniref:Uncharacterized protein n=1 Tax=marine sediment metagenome TaxID=412755 RepID=X0UX31_9ZZZZ